MNMQKTVKLIVNDSYWSFFDNQTQRTQEFISPNIEQPEFNKLPTAILTRNIAMILHDVDTDKSAKYGIEIKTNGSSRSSRIPLVRYSKSSQSVWKVIKSLKDFEKGAIELKDLVYYLEKTRTDIELPLPHKVLVLTPPEGEYGNTSNAKFINDIAMKHTMTVISLEYLQNLIKVGEKGTLNELFSDQNSILTTQPISL